MKKIILAIAVVALIAPPALAVDWNFYGSARMQTFYNSRDFNNTTNTSDLDGGGLTLEDDFDDDDQVKWDLQSNSRLGATVRAENIRGRFEFGINESDVTSRRIFGTWDFGAATLKVGKDYGPVTQFISGQAFDTDLGLLGFGAAYGSRNGQVALAFGGFEIALIENKGGDNVIRNIDTGDVDEYLPRIEAGWGMSFDTWNFGLLGGFQWYEIEDAGVDTEDVDVVSWLIGGDIGFNFGPVYLKAAGSYGQNWSNAGWAAGNFVTGVDGQASASFDGDDDTDDVDVGQAALIAGWKFTDNLTFETGFGMIFTDSDAPGEDSTESYAWYLQGVISMAPGVWLLPEVGYFDFGDDFSSDGNGRDQGDQLYVGAKWQIDF